MKEHTVLKNENFSITRELFREINFVQNKKLFSRKFFTKLPCVVTFRIETMIRFSHKNKIFSAF